MLNPLWKIPLVQGHMYCSLRHSWLVFQPPFTWLETWDWTWRTQSLRAPTVGSPSPLTPHQGKERGPSSSPASFHVLPPLSHSKLPCLCFENRTLRYGMRQHFLWSPQARQHAEEWKGRCISFQGGSSERPVFVSLSFVKLKGVRFPRTVFQYAVLYKSRKLYHGND